MDKGVKDILLDYVDEKNIADIIEDYAIWMNVYYKYGEDWNEISRCKGLTEKFILECADKLNWNLLCIYQNLSEDFIEKNIHQFDINHLTFSCNLSYEFVMKHKNILPYRFVAYHERIYKKLHSKK